MCICALIERMVLSQQSVIITSVAVICCSFIIIIATIVVCQLIVLRRCRHRRQPHRPTTNSLQHLQRYTVALSADDDITIDVNQLPVNNYYEPDPTAQLKDDQNDRQFQKASLVYPHLSSLQCDRNTITYRRDLRNGAFGSVFLASFTTSAAATSAADCLPAASTLHQFVVVKTLRPDVDETSRVDFLRTGDLVASLHHPNIVEIVGACIDADPMCLVFEYMQGGELGDYLHNNRPQHHICRDETQRNRDIGQLLAIVRQIASAMVYFTGHGYIHRDLATRNCLVGTTSVKLADFGLAVPLEGNEFHIASDEEEIPVRWMPPEAIIESRFAVSSDVYSFGVFVWEVFSYGAKPYEELTSQEAARRIVNRRFLDRPDLAPPALYDLMKQCWTSDPVYRPNFSTVLKSLSELETNFYS